MRKQRLSFVLAVVAAVLSASLWAEDVTINYDSYAKAVRPELHGAAFAPRLRTLGTHSDITELLRDLNLAHCRTHDLSLHDGGMRVIDIHHIFPLMSRDPEDATAYDFRATDALIAAITNCGMKIVYRLGNSIENPASKIEGYPHYNHTVSSSEYATYASVMSHIIAHYNEGWANGHHMNIEDWEIWNEPDNGATCWGGTQAEFNEFFATCVKKIKGDNHPGVRVGGPGLTGWNPSWINGLLTACQNKGVTPDFISYHNYNVSTAAKPSGILGNATKAAVSNLPIYLNEWHYLTNWNGWKAGDMTTIQSGVYNVGALIYLSYSDVVDQAQYYGSGFEISYSLVDEATGAPNYPYYGLKMVGAVMKDFTKLYTRSAASEIYALGAKNADETRGCALIADFRGSSASQTLTLALNGVSNVSNMKVWRLSEGHRMEEVSVTSGTSLTLDKGVAGYGAFLVTFDIGQ